jgi:osmoprotectant transport system permease protein
VTSSLAASDPSCLQENAWICFEYLKTRQERLVDATTEHIMITLVSVAVGIVVAVPLTLFARRYRTTEGFVLGASTAIYTIPSLAMFSLLLPYLGLSPKTVVVGLALYSLTILVRNMLAGLAGVPAEVKEAAAGMGYGSGRMLVKVEVPLALPTIFAGIRVATVSTVALTTVGAIVGFGGLGNLLYESIRTKFKAEIFTASVLCVLLAVAFDLVLLGSQKLLTPWTRQQTS